MVMPNSQDSISVLYLAVLENAILIWVQMQSGPTPVNLIIFMHTSWITGRRITRVPSIHVSMEIRKEIPTAIMEGAGIPKPNTFRMAVT